MTRFYVAALIAVSAVSAQAQGSAPGAPIEPSPDTVQQRQSLRALTVCLANTRPRWARQTLAHPYLSEAQAFAAGAALSGRDTCLLGTDTEVTFRTSGLVASLAEHFLQAELNRADFDDVAAALFTLEPRNASEDFALCVAARNPAAARDLSLSEPGSAAENDAARRLGAHVAPCFHPNERQQPVDLQSLRALISTALYRSVRTALAGGS